MISIKVKKYGNVAISGIPNHRPLIGAISSTPIIKVPTEIVGISYAREIGVNPSTMGNGLLTSEKWAKVSTIQGNSVVWNQLVNHNHWRSTTNNGITFTVEDDGKIIVNGTATGLARIMVNPYFGLKANHKYALTGAPNNANGATLRYFGTGVSDKGDGCIISSTTDAYNALAVEVTEGLTVNNVIFYPKLTDLTQMFGAGNEPTTIEEFEKRKPIGVTNDYNEGEIISYQQWGCDISLVSVANDTTTTTLLPNVSLIKDADGNQLFPYGLCSAGSAYDEINGTKAIKRVGVVDMGTLNWSMNTKYPSIMSIGFAGKAKNRNLLTAIYTTLNKNFLFSESSTYTDKTIAGTTEANGVYVKDTSYTDADSFKQAMQGVLLYYELATPIEVEIDKWKAEYKVEQGGTEQIVSTNDTTNLKTDIIYGNKM